MFDIIFRGGWTLGELESLEAKYSRSSLSSSSSSASGFSASIPSDNEAGDSELESESDYYLHDFALKEYCDTVRDVETEHGLPETNESNERIRNSFFTTEPRHGLANSLAGFHKRLDSDTLRSKRNRSPIPHEEVYQTCYSTYHNAVANAEAAAAAEPECMSRIFEPIIGA